jgi:hypothetical protein
MNLPREMVDAWHGSQVLPCIVTATAATQVVDNHLAAVVQVLVATLIGIFALAYCL